LLKLLVISTKTELPFDNFSNDLEANRLEVLMFIKRHIYYADIRFLSNLGFNSLGLLLEKLKLMKNNYLIDSVFFIYQKLVLVLNELGKNSGFSELFTGRVRLKCAVFLFVVDFLFFQTKKLLFD